MCIKLLLATWRNKISACDCLSGKMKTCALHLIGFITVPHQFWDACLPGYVNKISCHVEIGWSCCCNFLFRLKWHECTNLRSEGVQSKNEASIHFSDGCEHSHIRLRPSLKQLPQSCLLLQIKHAQIQSTAHGGKNKKEELLQSLYLTFNFNYFNKEEQNMLIHGATHRWTYNFKL